MSIFEEKNYNFCSFVLIFDVRRDIIYKLYLMQQ